MQYIDEYNLFDWKTYVNIYSDLKNDNINTKDKAWYHWINYGKKENRIFFNMNEIVYFDWKTYVNNYDDLIENDINTKEKAWYHWLNHGKNEERTFLNVNTSKIHNCRFGNLFFINMACHFISIKYDLLFEYKYHDMFRKFGIDFFVGTKTYKENTILSDDNFLELIHSGESTTHTLSIELSNIIPSNLKITLDTFCHNKDFCIYLKKYFYQSDNRKKIINSNIFKKRYNANNDLFIHVRLGDIEKLNLNETFEYYDNNIKKINFDDIYISSDDINNTLCTRLINKYDITIIDYDEVETIMFANTCNNIILSGNFSYKSNLCILYINEV